MSPSEEFVITDEGRLVYITFPDGVHIQVRPVTMEDLVINDRGEVFWADAVEEKLNR